MLLSDGEANLLPNARHNLAAARASPGLAATADVALLRWDEPPHALAAAHGCFDVLLGADLVYSSGAARPLAAAASALVR